MILALDIASVTGCAVGLPGRAPRCWTVDLGRDDDVRLANALRVTDRLLREHQPSLVAIEAPVGGPRTSHLLVGLVACVRGACRARGVRVEAFNIASIRRHFLGGHVTSSAYGHLPVAARKAAARRAGKAAVVARCRALGWAVRNDNEADACALWDYAASRESHAHAAMTAGGLGL